MVAPIKELKWAILGSEGQLGRAMSAELARSNCNFIALSHRQLDITNRKEVESFFPRELPNVVLNAAAWTNVDLAESHEEEAQLINAYGPKLLAEMCAKFEAKFIHISTDYVFSGISNSPWAEDAELSPISAYGRSKAAGELSVLEVYPKGTYVVRTAWLYSPWGKNFVKTLLKFALEGSGNIEVVLDQVGQPTSAVDLAEHIQRMIVQNVSPGIYHGTNSGETSWYELAKRIFKLAGENPERVIAAESTQFLRPATRPAYSVLGKSRWENEGLKAMQSWEMALDAAFPSIIQAIKRGE